MERIYIEYDMAKFTRKDITLVDVELYDGRSFQNLEPRRLFPVSGLEKYITLLDETGVEKAITFEFSHFMSPHSMYSSAHGLFDRYMEYREEVLKRS